MNKKLLSLYGLKYNPFGQEVPVEALLSTPKVESLLWRLENSQVREGGFALICGDPGTGKSAVMRLIVERLNALGELTVGELQHPQSNVADFYRELGDVFGVKLRPHNRWAGFRVLRERWQSHIDATLLRPVLLIDEAQQMTSTVFTELRVLSSSHFDSRVILTVILAGDSRLLERLRQQELLPLGSRLRTRLVLDYADRDELLGCLRHRLRTAGNAGLMTTELMTTLVEHAGGNYRVLMNLAADLLAAAAEREITTLDEKLYFDVFAPPGPRPGPRPQADSARPGRSHPKERRA
jgi:type II secretory pathway predicted ATPase ExeA